MARPTGVSSAPKKDWRARPPEEEATSAGRYFRRFFYSLLLVGLAVGLAVLLIPGCPSHVQMVCLPITDYEMTVAPVPYAARNLRELRTRLEGAGIMEVSVLEDLDSSQSMASLSHQLQPMAKAGTVLMLYMSAHGVSENGKAYLLCSDYNDPQTKSEGRFEFGELLGQISVCKAKPKLLILDVASIAVDPRLGFVVNEFPRLAEDKVRETADQDLYVLLSYSALEQSHVSHAARRSLFNYYVAEGLHGAANRKDDNDYVVDLAEFYSYVRDGVAARTAQQTNEQETQLPRLLRGGEGFCGAVPEGLTLVKVPPEPAKKKDAEAEKKGEKKGEGKAAKEDRTADGAEKSKGGANSPDAGSEPGKSEPKAESPPATPPGASERGAKGGAAVADPPEPKAASDAGPAKDSKSPTKPRKTAEAADKASPPAKADKKGEGKGEKEEAKGDKEDEKSEAPAKAAEAKSGPPVAAPAAEAAPASVPALLAKAWQHRDRMRLRSEANPWSPVDYAPHLWREYNEMLLGFELRHRYDVALPQQRRNALRDLAAGDEGTSGLSDESILGRLRRARQDFFGDAVKLKKFEQARGEGLGEIEEAMRLRNDLMFAAPYYVRWHAQIAMTASTDSPLYGRIAKLLDEDHLPKLVRLLESLENPPASDSAQYDLDDLRKTKRSVEDVGTELENGPDGPRRVAEELLKGPPKQFGDLRKIEALLSIPLLAAEVRAPLIKRLEDLDRQLEWTAPRRSGRATETAPPRHAWDRYGEQLRLEAALARLAKPDFNLAAKAPAAPADGDGEVWEDFRKLGHELAEFYKAMPGHIDGSWNSETPAAVRQAAARFLRMIDARDVSGPWTEKAARIALVPPELPKRLRIKLDAPDKTTLDRNKAVPIDVVLQVSGPCGDQARLLLEYDTGRIEVVDLDDAKKRIPAGEQKPIRLDRNRTEQSIPLHLSVDPKKENLNWTESRLTLRVTSEKVTATHEIRLGLEPPDVVDVVVERIIDLVSGRPVAADRISGQQGGGRGQTNEVLCDVFPNRTTEYVVSLKNQSGKPKKVSVELYSPPSGTGELKGPLDTWGKPLSGYRHLASAADVDLDADGTKLAIPFGKTKADPKKEEAEEAKQPAEKGEKKATAEPDRPLVSRGLACVIYDLSAKEPKPAPQVRWLSFRPVAPRQFLEPKVTYDPVPGRIRIEVKPLQTELLPRLSEETPIKIDWDVQRAALDPNSQALTHAEINAPGKTGELFADVPPKPSRDVRVQLAVDGYPRAFMFTVPTGRPERIEELRDERDVRIVAPRTGAAFRIPLAKPPLFVEFEVDAPADAFRAWATDKPRDFVEVTMATTGQGSVAVQDPMRFYSDRQFVARVVETGAGGLLKIDAQASDFKVPLNPGQVQNAEVAIRVAMSLTSAEGVASAGRVVKTNTVIFDAAKPTVQLIEAPRAPVTQGNNVIVIVEAKDTGSGVAKIECGLREGESPEFEEKDKPATLLPPNIQPQPKIPLPTKELKPGKYSLLARVTDRVGWQTTERLGYVEIVEPPPPPPKPEPGDTKMAGKSSISGRAVLGSPDASVTWIGLKVTLKELNRTVTTGPDGKFEFSDVPPGPYTLEAKGIGANKLVQGSTNVTVTEKPAKVDLPME